ncbi:Cutinase 3 [Colletotrichum chrysophilum]|uniref:Cutinase n=1 Tax=Colletotrichum chrysophilum TaxID=1836956 RepID=A0AAD9AB94_9PEZI|nr:Cutinase 3 [Colletotrichum chrysophilum]
MVVFARGTYEIGNVGVLVGAPFLQVLRELSISGLTIEMQGVEYAANMTGYQLGGDPEGSQKMADTILEVQNQCPRAKVVVSGYSQGAQLVHNALKELKGTNLEEIDAVVTFGDPLYPQIPEGVPGWKMLSVCNAGDGVCRPGRTISLSHISYVERLYEAATFVV